uniref:Putative secreted peptide n=1 Tax=Anopheles braziliensis TaxID=58242 RepID=A0A2M3ZRB3_9DIPT
MMLESFRLEFYEFLFLLLNFICSTRVMRDCISHQAHTINQFPQRTISRLWTVAIRAQVSLMVESKVH